jgi:hypothetical protein
MDPIESALRAAADGWAESRDQAALRRQLFSLLMLAEESA